MINDQIMQEELTREEWAETLALRKQEENRLRLTKPDYALCNRGHELMVVVNERGRRVWDCPTCIRAGLKRMYALGVKAGKELNGVSE